MAKRVLGLNDKSYRIGEDHQRAKLTDRDVELIQQLLGEGLAPVDIAAKFGVSRQTICDIRKGRKRGQTPTKWKIVRYA